MARLCSSSGRANEVNYWIFDYPPEQELEVRECIAYLQNKNQKGTDGFDLVVFDLYDIIIDFLIDKNFYLFKDWLKDWLFEIMKSQLANNFEELRG